MGDDPDRLKELRSEVAGRFGIVPNVFRSAKAAPELLEQIWSFGKAAYLDNPMPPLLKERLFVFLSRFCPARYCIARHLGFLLGYGRPAGDPHALPQTIDEVIRLLKRPAPWQRDMAEVYEPMEALVGPMDDWPSAGTVMEDRIFACAAVMSVEPACCDRARRALQHTLGARRFEFLCGCLAAIRTAHFWAMLHPEIAMEEDVRLLVEGHDELGRLLFCEGEAGRYVAGEPLPGTGGRLDGLHERLELENARRAMEEKDRQKDKFIAILAHELRNPLAAIRAATDAMGLIGWQDPRAVRLHDRLERQTTAMARMLDDLLEASRIALGKISVQAESVDLHELLQDILDEQEPRIRGAGLEIEIASAPCVVRGDRVRLRQIIDNLFSNAIKFTPQGGSIALTLAVESSVAVLSVKDSGVGFDAALAGKLFEPFVQEEQGLDRRSGGLGLGLAIASRLAELQGGSLSAESGGRGRGAVFRLRMPLDVQSASVEGSPRAATHEGTQASVLLVEDNSDVADGMAELLQLSGFQVSVACDGPSAVSRALAPVPDIILCDLGLPGGMDGFAVARACRAEPALKSVRLIAVSGYSAPEDHANARMAGFERLLTKPLTRESLDQLLR